MNSQGPGNPTVNRTNTPSAEAPGTFAAHLNVITLNQHRAKPKRIRNLNGRKRSKSKNQNQ